MPVSLIEKIQFHLHWTLYNLRNENQIESEAP